MKIRIGGEEIEVDVARKKGLGVYRGLMFRSLDRAPALLFEIKSSLHSFFVWFPFLCLWLDSEDNVVDKKIVKPFTFYINSKKKFSKIVEIPLSRRYQEVVERIISVN
tara:strand:- start:18063 stop:18386 length:324 start_codon:yes stop_codon:yes gene_type:complete